jgi:hypothetical protein
MIACEFGNKKLALALVKKGANIETKDNVSKAWPRCSKPDVPRKDNRLLAVFSIIFLVFELTLLICGLQVCIVACFRLCFTSVFFVLFACSLITFAFMLNVHVFLICLEWSNCIDVCM